MKKPSWRQQSFLKTMPQLSAPRVCLAENCLSSGAKRAGHHRDFLSVKMGHASQPPLDWPWPTVRSVYCFDGDGAALMHMGSMAITGQSKAKNLIHWSSIMVFTVLWGSRQLASDMPQIATACGYATAKRVDTKRSSESNISSRLPMV